jgi:hypothetical protein
VADAAAARLGELPEDYADFLTTSSFTRPTLAAGLGIGGRISDLRRRVIMLVERRRPLESKSPRVWNLVGLPIAVALVATIAALAPQSRLEADNRLEAGGGRLEEEEQGADAEPADEAPAADATPAAKAAPAEQPVEPTEPTTPVEVPDQPDAVNQPASVGPVEQPVAAEPVAQAVPDANATVEQVPTEVVETVMENGKPVERKRTVMQYVWRAPSGPRKIKPGDMLMFSVQDNFQSLKQPGLQLLIPSGEALEVDEEGSISFGSAYGGIKVADDTLGAAEKRISQELLHRVQMRLPLTGSSPHEIEKQREQLGAQMQINVRLRFINTNSPTLSGVSLPRAYPGPTVTAPVTTHLAQPVLDHAPQPATPEQRATKATPAARRLAPTPGTPTAQPTPSTAPIIAAPVAVPAAQPTPATAPTARLAPQPGPTVAPYINALQRPTPVPDNDGLIKPGDLLSIELAPEEANKLVKRLSVVEPNGMLALGVTYGRVQVAGLSHYDAEQKVKEVVAKVYRDPVVQITHADATNIPRGFGLPVVLSDDEAAKKLQQQNQTLQAELRHAVHQLNAKNKPPTDTNETKKLQQEIDQLKATIRDLKKQQSSATGNPSQSNPYAALLGSNPYQQNAAPSSQLRNAFNPFAPNGPVGPLEFGTPPADQPETKDDDPFKPNIKPNEE